MISFRVNDDNSVRIDMFDVISGLDSGLMKYAFSEIEDKSAVEMHLASPGGDLDAGILMRNALAECGSVTLHCDGTVASAATLLLCNGNTHVVAHKGATFMIHMSATELYGNKSDMEKAADMLEKYDTAIRDILATRFNGSEEELNTLLENETWMTAREALACGLIDEIDEESEEQEEPEKPEESEERQCAEPDTTVGECDPEKSKDIRDTLSEINASIIANRVAGQAIVIDVKAANDKLIMDLTAVRDGIVSALEAYRAETAKEDINRKAFMKSLENRLSEHSNIISEHSKDMQTCVEGCRKANEPIARAYALEGLEFTSKPAHKPFTLEYTK